MVVVPAAVAALDVLDVQAVVVVPQDVADAVVVVDADPN